MNRRHFLKAGLAMSTELASLASGASPASPSIPVIDSHIHLFDPTRPEGIPWPPKDDRVLYHPALPARYRTVTAGLGIAGAIEVECSPWPQDNQWVLSVAARDTIIVATVGNLEPGTPGFREQMQKLHRNPLFRGIRYGNLWGRDFTAALTRPAFIADIKALADAGLTFDSANPDPVLLANLVRLTDAVPTLRVVLDHLPQMETPSTPAALKSYESSLHELAGRPRVYLKISEVLRRVEGKVPLDISFYHAKLDELCGRFGEDRLLYGSDWPNSDLWAPYPQVFGLVREYFSSKSALAQEKLFWKNSIAAYRWVARDPHQRKLSRA